jgi:hypothetical protein
MKARVIVAVRLDLPPHAHDARIMEMVAELRRLCYERASDTKSARQEDRPLPQSHKDAISRGQYARHARARA